MDVGLIFGMVIAIIVISLVFVFGFQQLTNLQDVQDSAEMIRASENFVAAVDRVYNDGGESSEKVRLSFPSTVETICFVPVYDYNYNPKVPYTAARLKAQLVFQGLAEGNNAQVIAGRRATAKQADDKDYNVLVFFVGYDDPKWYAVEHLEPGLLEDGGDESIFCAEPKETIWLQRRYDSNGAWVDAEEA